MNNKYAKSLSNLIDKNISYINIYENTTTKLLKKKPN